MKALIIITGILLVVLVCAIKFLLFPLKKKKLSWKTFGAIFFFGMFLISLSGSFFYAEPGYSYLVQYPTGTQISVTKPGYHFYWYGTILEFKKVVTVRLSDEKDKESDTATLTDNSVSVRFNDAVSADVSSSTRFRLPEDPNLFMKMALDYRSLENLVQSSLVPVTREVIRNSARELSAQDYVTGQGGQFEQNVLDQLEKGIVILKIVDERIQDADSDDSDVTSIANAEVDNIIEEQKEPREPIENREDRGIKETSKVYRRVVRVVEEDGNLKRKKHPLVQYGIQVIQSTIEKVQPEIKFKEMLAHQRDAAARSAVARQEAKQSEYEKQKVIAQGETEKARMKMEREKEQINIIITAETEEKKEQINLRKAKIKRDRLEVEAEALLVKAKAEADAQRAKMQADGALEQKLEAWVSINKAWADAAANHQMVPTTVIGNGQDRTTSAQDFMSMMTAMSANQLSLNAGVK